MNTQAPIPEKHHIRADVAYTDPDSPPPVIDEALHIPARTARVLGRGSMVLAIIAGTAIMLLMFATTGDVVSRKGGGGGFPGVVEWTEVLLVVVVFAGLMGAELSGAHIRGMSSLTDRPNSVVAPALRFLGSATAALILVWAAIATANAALASVQLGEYRMGLVQVPIWPAKLVIPIGLAGFAAMLGYRAITQWREALHEAARRSATKPSDKPEGSP